MAAQKGADLLMKIGDGGSPESFKQLLAVCGQPLYQ